MYAVIAIDRNGNTSREEDPNWTSAGALALAISSACDWGRDGDRWRVQTVGAEGLVSWLVRADGEGGCIVRRG